MVRNDSGINLPKDFANKVFASPQFGNMQDIALRKYLRDNGYQKKDNGGNVSVTPVDNPTILTLFLKMGQVIVVESGGLKSARIER